MEEYDIIGIEQSITVTSGWNDIASIVYQTFKGIFLSQSTNTFSETYHYPYDELFQTYIVPSPEEKFDSYQTRALGSLYRFPVRRYVRKLFNPDSVRLQFTVQDFSLDSELNIKSDITESELLTTIYTTSDWRKKADRIISTVTDYLVEQDIPYLVGELPITQ